MIRSMPATAIAVLHGDQTGEELLREALRVLDPGVLDLQVETRDFDLSLEERRHTRNQCVLDAAEALRQLGFGIKAATITPEGAGDVGSPNAILRKQIDGRVIVRTGRRIPHVRPLAGVHAPISVIRMAVDDAYGAREWREGHDLDEWAYRTEKISRRTCRIVADYAFRHARRIEAKVFGGPKFTVSPVYEGMFKEELDAAAGRHPDVRYEPHLIDATYALLLATSGEALVIPALNRDGDTLSDLVMQMFGTIAGAESTLLAFDESGAVTVAMTEAPHGTAPALEGKNVANPMATVMSVASLRGYMKGEDARRASRAIYEAALDAGSDCVRTADRGRRASTSDFTAEVVHRVNDLVQGRTPEQYRDSLRTIYEEVATLKLAAGRVAAVSIPTWSYAPAAADYGGAQKVDKLTSAFNAVAREEAKARDFTWVDIGPASTARIGSPGWIGADQLHPGDAQYAVWADAIWSAVRESWSSPFIEK